MTKGAAITAVIEEMEKASVSHKRFNSTHEAYAVLLEEVDELWDAIKEDQSIEEIREEAIQVAAMALRLLTDCA